MESNDKIKNPVKRIEDQIKGILRMLDDNKDSKKVITQFLAFGTAMDSRIDVIVSSNLIECIQQMDNSDPCVQEDIAKEAVERK